MPRMRILTASEQDVFDKPPLFDHRERKQFFNFPKGLMDIATMLRTYSSQIGFFLMCGYFRATKQFYQPQDFHDRDIEAVAKILGLQGLVFSSDSYTKQTRARHQEIILDFYGFVAFGTEAEGALVSEIATMARMNLKPRLMFDRCTDFLMQRRIQVPRAGTLLELIRRGLQARKGELMVLMDTHLTPEIRYLLDYLFSAPQNQNRYRLTLLKKLSQSTKPARIKECIEDFETLSTLYTQLESIFSVLDLGVAGIRYYGGSVLKSEVFQIQRREIKDRYLHAVAFVAHQFLRMQDNLVDLWLSVMSSFQATTTRKYKEKILQNPKAQQGRFQSILKDFDISVCGLIQDIRNLTNDANLQDEEKISAIRQVLDNAEMGPLKRLKADLKTSGQDQSWHNLLEENSLRLQKRLNLLLRVLNFQPNERAARLLEAIQHFKECGGAVTERVPINFLDAEERSMILREDGTFRPSLYKVLLFQHVTSALKSGDLNLAQSYKYRPMDSYLLDPQRWKQEKTHLLEQASLTEFADPGTVLEKLDNALYAQYQATNKHVPNNPYLKFRTNGVFHIATPARVVDESLMLGALFPEKQDVPLAQVLETINNYSGMLNSFEHWRQTHNRQATSPPVLLAGIIGLGCGIGVRKMARISSRITEHELENAVNWRFSLQNIRAANDAVVKAMDEMELPNLYRGKPEALHTASDDQKFEVRGDSLHASRSFKYFGQGQGISAYTFVDERHFLWYSLMISASDRESAYVIDGLMYNDIIKSNIHSTDTHGYTEAVFGLTHLLGFSFAPRIKGIGKQRLYLFCGHHRPPRDEWKIAPDNYVNVTLIRENWDDLLRLVATIKLKENNASDIFRRLNSYSRQHALYQTLKAFGQIIKSLFILRYVDDVTLRQAIENQLNKVELANKFSRAVAVGNPREFTQVEKEEQEIAQSCNRLIKNSIVCWNYLYLTRQIEKTSDPQTREIMRQIIARHSPMAWAHINMLGEYDFSDEKLKDSIGILPLKSTASKQPNSQNKKNTKKPTK